MLRAIAARGDNLSAPLAACGEIMRTSIDRNFEAGGRFSSAGDVRGGTNRWADLAPSTKRSRISDYRILQGRGHLAASFVPVVSGNNLIIGSNLEYAAIHHYGGTTKPHLILPTYGKALAFPTAGGGKALVKSVRHPGSVIPARPILVVQDQDVDDMVDVLGKHVVG